MERKRTSTKLEDVAKPGGRGWRRAETPATNGSAAASPSRRPVLKRPLVIAIGVGLVLSGSFRAAENRTYIIQFYKRFDRNSDGRLEPDEWQSSRSSDAIERAIEDAGLNPDETVSLKTLIDSRLRDSSRSRTDDDKHRGYRSKIGHERLGEEVPDWFRDRDRDRDGQVAMAEFAKHWTDELVADFLKLDVNRDGLITPKELAADEAGGRSSLASTQTNGGGYKSSRSTGGSSSGDDRTKEGAATNAGGKESTEDIPAAYLNYAKGICKKYDADSDGFLTKEEWSGMSQDPSAADANRDGKITYIEYARWIASK